MLPLVKIFLLQAVINIMGVFYYIIPEFPLAGVVACVTALALFLIYLVKRGLKPALKIGLTSLAVMVFAMYAFHSLTRVFRAVF